MKNVLIILSQNDQSDLSCNESIAALMLFASFGMTIHVLFRDAALSLLAQPENMDVQLKQFLKPAHKMVESFEFYDIEQLLVCEHDLHHPLVKNSPHKIQGICLNAAFLAQFDHVIFW